jgi:glycine dehydrogenase subunit 2
MKLIFEKSVAGRGCSILPPSDTPITVLPEAKSRKTPLVLPEVSENDISRHYSALAKRAHGVNDGFYPLGSCTMKYNPKINETAAALPKFTDIHPLQPIHTVQGCMEVLYLAEKYLCEITGMDNMSFQPAAGAHGELAGLLLIKKYHETKGDAKRTKMIVPDSAHGTNPATATMAGMTVVNVPSGPDGCVDLEKLRAAAGDDIAGLMLTNPNTIGLFEKDINEIAKIVHDAGGLLYYDGANLTAVMGIARPGDMGFDCVHLNLHKTFAAPHGGGGPGSGPVGCKEFLAPYLPKPHIAETNGALIFNYNLPESIGRLKGFYGNFLVVVKSLAYIFTIGAEGAKEVSQNAVLNANYMMKKLSECYDMAYDTTCMHEFVITLTNLKKEKNVSAMYIAKALLDNGIHQPTMYFPLIVDEALMVEPTETESKETIDEAVEIFLSLYRQAMETPEKLRQTPLTTPVRRVDEVTAARSPKLKYQKED